MGPEKRKGERTTDEAAEGEAGRARTGRGEPEQPEPKRGAGGASDDDPREEEGYFQPESSAQKGFEVKQDQED